MTAAWNQTIVVAEDDRATRELLVRQLERAGHTVRVGMTSEIERQSRLRLFYGTPAAIQTSPGVWGAENSS